MGDGRRDRQVTQECPMVNSLLNKYNSMDTVTRAGEIACKGNVAAETAAAKSLIYLVLL